MHTARLLTVRALATRCQYWWGGPQVNKFEQVSSDGHRMSPAEAGAWGCQGWDWGGGAAGLYSEVQCIMSNGHMGPLPHEQTDRHK